MLTVSKLLRSVSKLLRCIRELRPTIVHCHGGRAGLPTAIMSMLSGQDYIYTVHGFHFAHNVRSPLRQLARAAEAFCISRAGCTVFVSVADLEFAQQQKVLSRSRGHRVIKNAVEIDRGIPVADKRYDIGFLGRLHHQKNPLILIDILKAMRPARPSMCIIGGGELEPALRARIATEGLGNQIVLTGEQGHNAAMQFVAQCRVLVLPSLWEGHPLALIEAMHLGVPIIASDVPGNRAVVVDGETGFLVSKQSVAGYADRVSRLLSDAELSGLIIAAARAQATREYSVERYCAAYTEVYRQVVGDQAWEQGHDPMLAER